MVAVGLVLLVLAALLTLGIVFSNTDPSHAAAFGVTLSQVSIGGLFLVGVVTGAVGLLGLTLMLGGGARRRRKRVEARRAVRGARSDAESLAEENARLAAALDQTRGTAVPGAGDGAEPTGGRRLFRR